MYTKMLVDHKKFYNDHLTDVILDYWIDKVDNKNGGFYTCYNVKGDQLVSKNKYTWSQGRCTWMYSKLAMSKSVNLSAEMKDKCKKLAEIGAKFLLDNCILPDGNCAFCLDVNNKPIETMPGKGFAISSFADCFVIMGLSAYGTLKNDKGIIIKAYDLFKNVERKVRENTFKTAPNILPAGWRSHAVPMIVLNTGYELSKALEKLDFQDKAAEVDSFCRLCIDDIIQNFMYNGIVNECLDANSQMLDTLYGRHINPGHTNECMWFLIKSAEKFNDESVIEKAVNTILNTSKIAWDHEFGGMVYYLDRDGGMPKGEKYSGEEELAKAMMRDWDNKMWWPHTETIYANLLGYFITENDEFMEEYKRYHSYTFSTFPNPDTDIGEWIQIRNRQGEPVLGEVGGRLPVKDPYHITRNLIMLIELLDEKGY